MLYRVTFRPILKSVIWGGADICPFKGIEPLQDGRGESWELSHVEGNVSVVAEGSLAGKSLEELINTYGDKLLGKKVMDSFGTTFPLLIKFIDARDHLSIQVHPDDELAAAIADHGFEQRDPVWRLPLWAPYGKWLESRVADLNNVSDGGMAGAVTAALFLQRFVTETPAWVHFDLYAWTIKPAPGRPVGAEAYALRALFALLNERYGI